MSGPGGGGGGQPTGFYLDLYPQDGDFDHLILQLQRAEGVGILKYFFRKCQNLHPVPDRLPLLLDIDRCITYM